jgi:hypothetical protein
MEHIIKENFSSNYNEIKFQNLYDFLHDSQETIRFLYNGNYGGFFFSEKIQTLLKEKGYDQYYLHQTKYRYDPYVLELYDTYYKSGEFSQKYCKIKVAQIPIYYKNYIDHTNYIELADYDGMESIDIHYSTFKLNMIQFVLGSNMNSEQKCCVIQLITDINRYVNW